jgi:hypothetical protein
MSERRTPMSATPAHRANVCTPGPQFLPIDTRAAQCERAGRYMEAHPGCTSHELHAGADLGSATKVISEMIRRYGFQVRRERVRVLCRDGEHSRSVVHYHLEAWPEESQLTLFPGDKS